MGSVANLVSTSFMKTRVRAQALACGVLGALATGLTPNVALAVAPRSTVVGVGARVLLDLPDTLVAEPGVAKQPLRAHVTQAARVARPTEWNAFVAKYGGASQGWQAMWDRATGAPMRIWGPGIAVPGAMASADAAVHAARDVLAAQLGLLAPGATVDDFVLVSNQLDGTGSAAVRSIGFEQWHHGMRVVGGQISFRFKADRLVVIGSSALPSIGLPSTIGNAKPTKARQAPAALASRYAVTGVQVREVAAAVVLPLISDDAVLGYRMAVPVTFASDQGNALVYADAFNGTALATRRTDSFVTGTVKLALVDRNPMRPRVEAPAARMELLFGAEAVTTDDNGLVTWSNGGLQTLSTSVQGPLVKVVNKTGAIASAALSLVPGGTTVWDESPAPERDSQVQVFANLVIVKRYVATFAPTLSILNEQLTANVNIDSQCNANFDGNAVNFFKSSMRCQNTALLSDVVFHEFGHAMHANAIIRGVGSFDGAMSEGLSDFLAAAITNDGGMGRGFFYDDTPLRDLDPAGDEAVWPRDIGEIHKTGIIFGGAMWDLRKALIAELGVVEGEALTNRLFYGAVQRATDIPSTLIELLVSDDDDGNLANGTPHECTIRTAFGTHGLRTVLGSVTAPGALEAPAAQVTQPVALTLRGLASNCTGDAIDKLTVYWKGKGGTPGPGNMDAVVVTPVANGVGEWSAEVPLARNGIVEFKAELLFKDGTYLTLPDNQGDPLYQMFEGKTVPLYCTSFEQDPFAAGWTTSASKSAPVFEWGNPAVAARLSATDPTAAFSGANILAQGLGKDYFGDSTSGAESPVIDLGQYSNVRLQYRRWLAIEDGHFDKARIIANGNVVWNNYDSNKGDASSVHTIDREWRFVDLPLAKLIRGHTLKLGFDLTSDPGLHLGGWQIDDLCVVADPTSICGDGVVSPSEQCDDGPGNADAADACHTDCFLAACGDGLLDTGEECDAGGVDSFACDNQCKSKISIGGGGLCSTSNGTSGATWLLALLGVGLGLRRRRR